MKPCNLSCFASLTILLTALAGCDSPLATSTEPSVTRAINELESRVARDGSFTFRSWEGKSIGMDSDTELTFLPNHTVHVTEYGYVVTGYKGMYRIDSKGEVTAKFDDFKHEWPIMLLQKDSISLLLRPKNGLDFVMGNRGGATIPGGKGSYWSFRPVSASEETEIRRRISKD